jgi:hypothetical protein
MLRSKKMKTWLTAVIVVVVMAVVGVGAFFAGTSYGEAQAQNTRTEFFRNRQGGAGGPGGTFGQGGQNGQNGQSAQNNAFGRAAAFGTVKSVNGNTIQLTQQDGSTVTITVNSQTTIQKTDNGTVADIQPGERLTVFSDQTGSNLTARAIQVRPNAQ